MVAATLPTRQPGCEKPQAEGHTGHRLGTGRLRGGLAAVALVAVDRIPQASLGSPTIPGRVPGRSASGGDGGGWYRGEVPAARAAPVGLSGSDAQKHQGEGQGGIRHRETQVGVSVPCRGLLCEAEGPSWSEGCRERAPRDQGEELRSWSCLCRSCGFCDVARV